MPQVAIEFTIPERGLPMIGNLAAKSKRPDSEREKKLEYRCPNILTLVQID
jgi:hypothetical protein